MFSHGQMPGKDHTVGTVNEIGKVYKVSINLRLPARFNA